MFGQSPHVLGGILWIQNPMRGMFGGLITYGNATLLCVRWDENYCGQVADIMIIHLFLPCTDATIIFDTNPPPVPLLP